jgi:hypothetical protein
MLLLFHRATFHPGYCPFGPARRELATKAIGGKLLEM